MLHRIVAALAHCLAALVPIAAAAQSQLNLEAAKRLYGWALTAEAQQVGLDVEEYAIPTNRHVVLPPMVPRLADIEVINHDFTNYGSSETHQRLLERWAKEINAAVQ